MNNSLVTVGVALYNHEKYIVECLKSIVNQTYKNIEIIVIDDGSPDNSYKVAKDYLESQNLNENYIIKTRPNKGMCNTLNEIAKMAKGKYISFVGSDDYWYPDKIELQVEFLDNHPNITLVHSNSTHVDENSNIVAKTDFSNLINSGNVYEALIYGTGGINTPSHLYRTSIYNEIGYYDNAFKFEDTDYWLRLSKEHQVGFIDKELAYCRRDGNNLSDNSNRLKFYNEELIKIYKKNITDPTLRKYIITKMLRKSYKRALRTFEFRYFFRYLKRYLRCKYLDQCE